MHGCIEGSRKEVVNGWQEIGREGLRWVDRGIEGWRDDWRDGMEGRMDQGG